MWGGRGRQVTRGRAVRDREVGRVGAIELRRAVIADKSGLRRPFQWIKYLSVEFISPDQHLCTEGIPNANDSQSRANRFFVKESGWEEEEGANMVECMHEKG